MFIKNVIKSNSFDKISYKLFNISCITLFLCNVFSMKYVSIEMIVAGCWEIPVDLVRPMKFTGTLSFILFLISLITGLLAIKCFIKQHYWIKLIYILWYLLTISITFINFENLPNHFVNFYIHYWYLGILIFLPFLVLLLHNNHKQQKRIE